MGKTLLGLVQQISDASENGIDIAKIGLSLGVEKFFELHPDVDVISSSYSVHPYQVDELHKLMHTILIIYRTK